MTASNMFMQSDQITQDRYGRRYHKYINRNIEYIRTAIRNKYIYVYIYIHSYM